MPRRRPFEVYLEWAGWALRHHNPAQQNCIATVFSHIVCPVARSQPASPIQDVTRVILVAAAMAATGIACAIVAALITSYTISDRHFGLGALGIVIAVMMAAYPIGAVTGLLLLRKWPGVKGSLLFGTLGCIIGVSITLLLAGALNIRFEPDALLGVYVITIPVLGAFGYLHPVTHSRNARGRRRAP